MPTVPRTAPRPSVTSRRAAFGGRLVRLAAGCGAASAIAVSTAGVAAAHVDPDPTSVTAGTEVTVAFGVEHGCDESPTVAMRFKIPAEVTDAKGVAKTGWTIDNQRDVVTFSGGELGHHTEDHFDISFTVPAGVTSLDFPVVQECAEGKLEWIAIAEEGQAEPDQPAPRVAVVGGSAAPTQVSAAGDTASTATTADTDSAHTEDGAASGTADGADGETTVTTVTVAEDGDEGGTSGIVYAVIGAVGAVLVATGVVMQLRRRK